MQSLLSAILSKQGSHIMATKRNVFATLACCLLAISFVSAQTKMKNWTVLTISSAGSDTTNSTVNTTVVSNLTENTTPFPSTSKNNTAFTETTSHTRTSELTTNTTSLKKTTPLTTAGNNTPAFTAPTIQTTTDYISTPDTTELTTAYSSNTANTTSGSLEKTAQGVRLNVSEKSLTIVFSVMLGLFGFGMVVFVFNRCRHKFQYLHQPLDNSGDTDIFVADDDTLVISGGLYDGHLNYDNAPTAPANESQLRLEFLQ